MLLTINLASFLHVFLGFLSYFNEGQTQMPILIALDSWFRLTR